MRWLRRAAYLLAALYITVFAALLAFILIFEPSAQLPEDAVIIVLGAGQRDDGSIGQYSAERIRTGVEIYRVHNAGKLIVTGGKLAHETRTVATAMAEAALLAGLPADRVIVEPRAQSTLQNALFSMDLVGDDRSAPLVLVTHRFHLPRAWASFRWAGAQSVILYPVDTAHEHWAEFHIGILLEEVAKSILNTARVGVASTADLIGIPRASYIRLLD